MYVLNDLILTLKQFPDFWVYFLVIFLLFVILCIMLLSPGRGMWYPTDSGSALQHGDPTTC